jgi:hypothetical protein
MKLTKNSELLMSFFLDKKCINHVKQTSKTEKILKHLYSDIKKADSFIGTQKAKEGDSFYKLSITKIQGVSQIPKPKSFKPTSFPQEIREHIDTEMLYNLSYTFSLFDREIVVHFVVEDPSAETQIEIYNDYIEKILVWLHVINEYSSKKCSKRLVLYLYFTSLKKRLPSSKINVLNEINVNTAFTYTCPVDSEIVIFRKEEWLKVLMHESFHNFSLDFSDMNNEECKAAILSIFKVNSDVNLFEAYTETWAEIMNAAFCSFYLTKNAAGTNAVDEFLSNFDFFINFERTYKFFQMVKTLEFMGLTYLDLISNSPQAQSMRETLYKEDSNVLSYYIISTIMMNNYQGFLGWCNENNLSLLQFKKTTANITEFCKFVEKNYKTRSLIESVDCIQKFLHSIKNVRGKGAASGKALDYVLNNMRMTVCELG